MHPDPNIDDWKIHWIAACTLFRSSIDLFREDKNICVSIALGEAVRKEWELIRENRDEHQIFWEFLREERNNIIHEYKWSAYHRWLDQEGEIVVPTLLGRLSEREQLINDLQVRFGFYKGRNAMAVLSESAAWVNDRVMSAIARAGLDPDELRDLVTFELKREPPTGLISYLSNPDV